MTATRILLTTPDTFDRAHAAIEHIKANVANLALFEFEVREYKGSRSTKSNAFYWSAVITPSADQLGYSPEELHRTICCALYGTHKVTMGKHEFDLPNKTTTWPKTMNTAEFTQHIEMASALLAEQGVFVETFSGAA